MAEISEGKTEGWQSVPSAARWLGIAGLIPFFVGAGLELAPLKGLPAGKVLAGSLVYGVAILSFLGGVAWGAAMARGERGAGPYILAVAPCLVGWFTLLFVFPLHQPFVLALAFGLLWLVDRYHVAQGRLPESYYMLRTVLTIGVVVSLIAGGFAVLPA